MLRTDLPIPPDFASVNAGALYIYAGGGGIKEVGRLKY